MSSDRIVRKPLHARERSHRTLDQRLCLRFPRLAAATFRRIGRLPPRSRLRQASLWRAAGLGLEATVLWSVQSFDWQDPDDPDDIVMQVLAEVEPGAIVLCHDGQNDTNDARPRSSTLAALPTILERLRSDGYEFLTVSELLVA